MKRTISVIMSLVMALSMLNTSAFAGLSGSFPDSFTGQWTGEEGCLNVRADAVIEVPDANSMPTATVQRRAFTQEEADRMIDVFLDGCPLYEDRGMSKSQVRERLEKYRAMERGEIPLELDGNRTVADLPEVIARWEKYLEEAPEDGELFPVSTEFASDEFYDGVIRGYGLVNGDRINIDIYNVSRWVSEAIVQAEGYELFYNTAQLPGEYPNSMTEKDALSLGDGLMIKLQMGDFICDDIEEVAFVSWESDEIISLGYKMQYVRLVDGLPLSFTPVNALSIEENSASDRVWDYERVTVCVTEGRVVHFNWTEPYGEVKTTDTAELMPFEDIADIFGKMILVTNDEISEINRKNGFDIVHNFAVDKVQLNLMRIRDKDNFTEGRIVPVWDFWATTGVSVADPDYANLVYDGQYYEIVLTINAMDGTVIDRSLGY